MAEVQERVRNNSAVALKEPLAGPLTELRDVAVAVPETGTQFVTPFSRSASAASQRQQSLNWAAPAPVAGRAVIQTPQALSQLWLEHGGVIAEVPAVDFDKSMVLAVFAGAGFFREVPSIDRVKVLADEVVVYVSRFSRPWSTHNAKAVIEVPQTELPVRFVLLS